MRQTLGSLGAGQTIAVIDTGIDSTNPDLSGRVISEACFSTTMPLHSSNLCPSGSDSTAAGSGAPCTLLMCWHVTHDAGITATNDGVVFGIAAQASFIAVQAFSNVGGVPRAYDSDVIQGVERVYALRNNFTSPP